ncbi:MAG: hypothetical protein IJX62_05790 [Clostridia bacterium]|nr:hypothetical protein [Clostridia bacterium]
MTPEKLSNAMDQLDAVYVAEALSHPATAAKRIRAKRLFLRVGSLVACLCLLLTSVLVGSYFYIPPAPNLPTAEKGIWIPQSPVYGWSLPPSVSCSLGPPHIFYQGQVYYSGRDLGELPRWAIGKKLGTTVGSIDGWTAEDGYEGYDFAGRVQEGYSVYTVKGYNPDFMICVEYSSSIFDKPQIVAFMNVDGFSLEKGGDLFDARLRLSTGYKSISYKADPWKDYPHATKPTLTAVDTKTMQRFLDAINAATFVYRQDIPDEARKEGIGTEELCRIYIETKHGLSIPLCLYKGGYVSFLGCVTEIYGTGAKDSLFGLAVQIDDHTLQALIQEMEANAK